MVVMNAPPYTGCVSHTFMNATDVRDGSCQRYDAFFVRAGLRGCAIAGLQQSMSVAEDLQEQTTCLQHIAAFGTQLGDPHVRTEFQTHVQNMHDLVHRIARARSVDIITSDAQLRVLQEAMRDDLLTREAHEVATQRRQDDILAHRLLPKVVKSAIEDAALYVKKYETSFANTITAVAHVHNDQTNDATPTS